MYKTNAKLLLASSVSALVLGCAGSAFAQSFTNNSGGEVSFYGQFTPAYLSFDDGEETYGDIVDNSRSNTRAGILLTQPLDGANTFGFRLETALGLPQSSAFSQDFDPIWNWEKTDIRHVDAWVQGDWGKLSFGQGSMASDGIAGSDLSGTTLASNVTVADVGGGYFWRTKDGDLSDVALKNTFKDFDGGRKGRVRYDTPDWNGFRAAIAYGEEVLAPDNGQTLYDLGLFYKKDYQAVQVAAALGYGWVDFDDDDIDTGESWAGSISALHKSTGLNGTFAMGGADGGGDYWYGKAGWIGELIDAGKTAFSVDYYSGSDLASDGDESGMWGIEAAQNFDNQNIEAYIAYLAYEYDDDSGVSYQDANSTLVGFRWKF